MLGRLKKLLRRLRKPMKNKWGNYAIKDGKVKDCYIREYINRKKERKVTETKCSNCIEQSGKEQTEVKEEVIAIPKIRSERRRKIKKSAKVVKKIKVAKK